MAGEHKRLMPLAGQPAGTSFSDRAVQLMAAAFSPRDVVRALTNPSQTGIDVFHIQNVAFHAHVVNQCPLISRLK